MKTPIYLPSGHVESTWLWDGASHEEDQAVVKDLGGFAWGPIKEETHGHSERWDLQ